MSVRSQIKDALASLCEKDRVTVPAGVAETGTPPFIGDNPPQGARSAREADANLEFKEAARLHGEVKRVKLRDLRFVADALVGEGASGDKDAVKRVKAEARRRRLRRSRRVREGALYSWCPTRN